MKRNLLAIVIPALLVAGSATASIEIYNKNGNKVDIFGKVKALNYLTKTGNDDGDHTKAEFGFNGYSVISNNLAGYGSFEYEAKANGKNETKYAYAGLDFGNAGQFDYGRNDGVLKALTAYTDVLPEFGGDASDNELYALSKRGTGVATYRNNNFFGAVDGLSFALQYADKQGFDEKYDPVTGTYTKVSNGDKSGIYDREAYGLNIQYSNILDSGFTLGAGYATTSKSKAIYGQDSKRGQTYMVGGNYDANNLYVGALFAYSKDMPEVKKAKGYELVVKYGFDLDVGRITPSLAYIQHKVKETNGDSYRNEHKYVDVGLTYDFNKNLSAIIDYKINLLKKEDVGNVKSKDTVALGLVYKF